MGFIKVEKKNAQDTELFSAYVGEGQGKKNIRLCRKEYRYDKRHLTLLLFFCLRVSNLKIINVTSQIPEFTSDFRLPGQLLIHQLLNNFCNCKVVFTGSDSLINFPVDVLFIFYL